MVNKITNWTFGGFFRTLGRTLAFILIGLLIALFCQKNDIKIGRIIGIEYVNAATITNWSTTQTRYWYDNAGTITNSGSWQTNPQTWSPSYPVARIQYRLTIPESFKTDSTYTFKVGWYSNPDSLGVETVYANFQGDDPTYANISCGNFTRDDNGYEVASCTVTPNTDIASGSYFYVAIHFYESYVTQLKSYIKGYTSQLGTNAVIEQQTGKIIDAIDDIFDNNRQNTTQIINNQNQNTQIQIESQQVCENINISKNDIESDGKYLRSNGEEGISENYGITNYLKLNESKLFVLLNDTITTNAYMCFYNNNKALISCYSQDNLTINQEITSPQNTKYVRFTISKLRDRPQFTIKTCKNGNQALSDDLKDDNVEGDTNEMAEFLTDFEFAGDSNISTLVTLPLTFLQNILVAESNADLCTTFRGKNICLPSGKILWNRSYSCNPNTMLCDTNVTLVGLRTILNIFAGGYLLYKMLRSIVITTDHAIDPDARHNVEMMKL